MSNDFEMLEHLYSTNKINTLTTTLCSMQEREATRPLTENELLRKLVAQMQENQHHCNHAPQQPAFWAQPGAGQAFSPASMGAPPYPQQGAPPQVQPGLRAQLGASQAFSPASMGAPPYPQQGAQPQVQPGLRTQPGASQAFSPASMGAPPYPQQGAQPQVQPGLRTQLYGLPPPGYVMPPVLPSWAGPGRQYGYGGQYVGMGSSGHGVSPCFTATNHVAQTAHMTGSHVPVVSRPNVEVSGVVYRVVEARVWPQFSSWSSMKMVRHPEEIEGYGVD